MTLRWSIRCAGCGEAAARGDPYEWACPNRGSGDDVDHVMARHLDLTGLPFVTSDSENPFVRYRSLLVAYHRWLDAGREDASFVGLVDELDDAVAAVDGRGFRRTPLTRFEGLDGHVWVKDETGNVSGSHKGRHLFGLSLQLAVLDRLGLVDRAAPLAIASCGNAALAAAVVARAAGRHLDVFVPPDAEANVVDRLRDLGAAITVCEREKAGEGDPCYVRFLAAVRAGALPFGCQGPDNGLTIEGGQTLAWEMAEAFAAAGVMPDRLVVQVGGGALGSACIAGLQDALALGVITRMPVIDAVQTTGAAPLARAHAGVQAAGGDLEAAAHHRSRFMWPWEAQPESVAHGILDDETYDWLAVERGMVATGGTVVVVDDARLIEANNLATRVTGIDVDATGSAGLAGLLAAREAGRVAASDEVAVIFSGARR